MWTTGGATLPSTAGTRATLRCSLSTIGAACDTNTSSSVAASGIFDQLAALPTIGTNGAVDPDAWCDQSDSTAASSTASSHYPGLGCAHDMRSITLH